jgi:phosphoglycolate phosphatase
MTPDPQTGFDVLVDLDGTITDPKPGIVGSFRRALETTGRTPPPADELLWIIGPPLRESFARIGVPAGEVEEALAAYRRFYQAGAMFDAPVYPGMPEALKSMRSAGMRLRVATSKPHVFAREILMRNGLASEFSAIHGAELNGTNDDKGDLIAYIVETENVDPRRAVMIGDRKYDVLGARRNGIATIGVTWGYGGIEELKAAGVDQICGSPAELPNLVAQVWSRQPANASSPET